HVIGKARGAADARDEDRVLGLERQVGAGLLHRLQDRVVAAAGAPAHLLVAGVVLRLRVELLRGRDNVHGFHPSSAARIAVSSSTILNGLPETFDRLSARSRYCARSSVTSWPLFISGTSTLS